MHVASAPLTQYTDMMWVYAFCVFLSAADGEEFVSVLTELLFELHVAATPDKLNKVTHTHTGRNASIYIQAGIFLQL